MAATKKFTAQYRQVGDGVWKATVVDQDGEETTSIIAESAQKAKSKVMREFAREHPDVPEDAIDEGNVISEIDLEDWEALRARWKRRMDELRALQEGEEKLFLLKMMGKYGMSPEQIAPLMGMSAPTIRQRVK